MQQCIVDNRVFLLGLDALYREAIRSHESVELLTCARTVASVLKVRPAEVPVEGYYAEEQSLTEYFRLLRALQAVDESRVDEVAHLPAFRRLRQVLEAPLFGIAQEVGKLLPTGRDSLSQALLQTPRDWTVSALTSEASLVAMATDDFSLVGLSARARDAVVLTALRESVVLYEERVIFSKAPPRVFVWHVDRELAQAAQRFVYAFNQLFAEHLPPPGPEHAERYWEAHDLTEIVGRCVCLGRDTSIPPRHYHWAICLNSDSQLNVQEFWSGGVCTTATYRATLGFGGRCPEVLGDPTLNYGDINL
jgi:hypothetical protein